MKAILRPKMFLLLGALLLAGHPAPAYYNPQPGRWLNRDPIGEAGGKCLYASVRNDPIGAVDPDGRIKVTTITAKPTTTCGSADNIEFNFTLDKPATEDGYIVQENVVSIPYVSGIVTGNLWTDHYWEAWFVRKNNSSPTTQSKAKYTDRVFWEGKKNSKGAGGIRGVIKFFFATKTKDLGDPGADPPREPAPESGWTWRNSSPSAGQLPSTRNERAVPWWNDPSDNAEATAERSVTVNWDCTCSPPVSTISVSP